MFLHRDKWSILTVDFVCLAHVAMWNLERGIRGRACGTVVVKESLTRWQDLITGPRFELLMPLGDDKNW